MNPVLEDELGTWLLERALGTVHGLLVVPAWSLDAPWSALQVLERLQRATGAERRHRRLWVGDDVRGMRVLWVYSLTEGYPVLAGRTWSRAWVCREASEVWELEVRTRLATSDSPCTIVDVR